MAQADVAVHGVGQRLALEYGADHAATDRALHPLRLGHGEYDTPVLAAGLTMGHPCTECGATMVACDATIRESGDGCCEGCFLRDTHGLLDKFKVVDVADLSQEVSNLDRLMAQMVLARHEHANAIRQLRAQNDQMAEAIARLEARQETVDGKVQVKLLAEVLVEVRHIVRNLPERVAELEEVAEALEAKLKLTRRPKEQREVPPTG
jgi:hypothetical protein